MSQNIKGYFTLPGEAGYEELTLRLAEKWGADVIRDSDGTKLSDKILTAGYDIYSTLCLVREDNAWAKMNMDKLQQNFLMSFPVTAESDIVTIGLLDGYFREQFILNKNEDSIALWQVFDRTTDKEVPVSKWEFDAESETVKIHDAKKWRKYTVNFIVYRIWEEISMYNHITNDWGDKEHLMAIEPRYPESQEHILDLLEKWLISHSDTNVVRFTSLFYNFCWYWGSDPKLRFIYSDWGSYDFTVNPLALKEFEKAKGYKISSEDFVNKGLYNSTHNVPSQRYRDWMDFTNSFVVELGRKCVDLVHRYGKKAYVFYDDHWIGVEPYSERFKEFGFDGIIKCVFNGFEARKCAGVSNVDVHELRLHPYLFPIGLKGEPTFKEGGNPALDCKNFWVNIRRALLRKPVDRIGFGGYLHLVEPFPDFIDYVEELTQEFRLLKSFHDDDAPYTSPCKVAVLTSWGKLRSWICSGHMHEHPEIELTQILESLAGLPVEVDFLSFDDILKNGIPEGIRVIINAGRLDTAWSGGQYWTNPNIVEKITEWVAEGGSFIGVGEPSASKYSSQYFQLSHILGVDREIGLSICKSKYNYTEPNHMHFITEDITKEVDFGNDADRIFVLNDQTEVLIDKNSSAQLTTHKFSNGRAVYLSGYKHSAQNARLLLRAIYWAANYESEIKQWTCSNIYTECAYYPNHKKLVVINNHDTAEETTVYNNMNVGINVSLAAHGIEIIDI